MSVQAKEGQEGGYILLRVRGASTPERLLGQTRRSALSARSRPLRRDSIAALMTECSAETVGLPGDCTSGAAARGTTVGRLCSSSAALLLLHLSPTIELQASIISTMPRFAEHGAGTRGAVLMNRRAEKNAKSKCPCTKHQACAGARVRSMLGCTPSLGLCATPLMMHALNLVNLVVVNEYHTADVRVNSQPCHAQVQRANVTRVILLQLVRVR